VITRRDVLVALFTATCTTVVAMGAATVVAFHSSVRIDAAEPQTRPVLGSATFDWDSFKVTPNEFGSQRQILRAPTATLDELEMHVTTLLPGKTSHEPHRHANEELVIIREGTLETFANNTWKTVGSGSVIFNASNELHGVRNVSQAPVTYHVVNWKSPGR